MDPRDREDFARLLGIDVNEDLPEPLVRCYEQAMAGWCRAFGGRLDRQTLLMIATMSGALGNWGAVNPLVEWEKIEKSTPVIVEYNKKRQRGIFLSVDPPNKLKVKLADGGRALVVRESRVSLEQPE